MMDIIDLKGVHRFLRLHGKRFEVGKYDFVYGALQLFIHFKLATRYLRYAHADGRGLEFS